MSGSKSKIQDRGVERRHEFVRHPAFYDTKVQNILKTRFPGNSTSKRVEEFLLGTGRDEINWHLGQLGHGQPWAHAAFEVIVSALEDGTYEPETLAQCLLADPEFVGDLTAAIHRAMAYPSADYAMVQGLRSLGSDFKRRNVHRRKLVEKYGDAELVPIHESVFAPVSRAEIAGEVKRVVGGDDLDLEAGVNSVGPHLNRIRKRRERIDQEWWDAAFAEGYFSSRLCTGCGKRKPHCKCRKWVKGERAMSPGRPDPCDCLSREHISPRREGVIKSAKKT